MNSVPGMSDLSSKTGMGGGGGGTLLDEMKKKGSLFAGDYGTQFAKVLEKTYGSSSKGLSVTLNPIDTMTLMSSLFQGMMIPGQQPYETAGAFSMASKPKTVQPESELSSLLNYGQNVLQVQQQLVTFMKDLLTKSGSKSSPSDAKSDPKSAAPSAKPSGPNGASQSASPTGEQSTSQRPSEPSSPSEALTSGIAKADSQAASATMGQSATQGDVKFGTASVSIESVASKVSAQVANTSASAQKGGPLGS
jgi:hypothetical protein